MKRLTVTLALPFAVALTATSCVHTGASSEGSRGGAPDREAVSRGAAVLETRPEVRSIDPFDAPVPTVETLSNGLRVYLLPREGGALEALQLILPVGSAHDPAGKAGVASLLAEMLEAGSAGRTQAEIAAEADRLGATLSVGAGRDATVLSISGLSSALPEMARLLADVAQRPDWREEAWQRVHAKRKARLVALRAEPSVAASRAMSSALYGDHPLGTPTLGTEASIEAISLGDLRAFYGRLTPEVGALVAVGGEDRVEVLSLLEQTFGGWRVEGARIPELPPAPAAASTGPHPHLAVVDFPGKPQTVLTVGQLGVSMKHPSQLPLRMFTSVLGGSFTSRLNQNLREKHGYTYGAGASFNFGRHAGPFTASASVKTEVTGAATRELFAELERALAAPFSEEELQKGRALLAFSLVQSLQSTSGTASALGELFLYELPLDHYRRYVPRLTALTAQEVQEAARGVLDPSGMTVVLSGDLDAVLPQLEAEGLKLAPPQHFDVEGRPLTSPPAD